MDRSKLLGPVSIVSGEGSVKKTHCYWCGKPMADTGSAAIMMPPDYGREIMPRVHGRPCASLSCTYHELYGLSQTFNHTKGIISERAYQKRRKVLLERYKSLYAEFREWYIEQYGEEDFYKNQEV